MILVALRMKTTIERLIIILFFIFLCILAVLCRAQRGEPARRCLHQWAPVAVCGEATHRGALRAGRASQRDLAPAARESRLHQQNIGQVNGSMMELQDGLTEDGRVSEGGFGHEHDAHDSKVADFSPMM